MIVPAKLNGRQGSFTFSHRATMMKDNSPSAGELSVLVVLDSGTGELTALTGSLIIHIDAHGKHIWTFDYSLP
jgi:hypothetical protein